MGAGGRAGFTMKRMSFWLCLSLLAGGGAEGPALGAVPGTAPAAARRVDAPMVLVLPWRAADLSAASRDALEAFLVADLAKLSPLQVISLDEVNLLVGVERLKDIAGCDTANCLSEVLGALNAPYFVQGTVRRLRGKLYFMLVLMDARRQRVLGRASADYSDDDYFFPFVVEDMVKRLVAGMAQGR